MTTLISLGSARYYFLERSPRSSCERRRRCQGSGSGTAELRSRVQQSWCLTQSARELLRDVLCLRQQDLNTRLNEMNTRFSALWIQRRVLNWCGVLTSRAVVAFINTGFTRKEQFCLPKEILGLMKKHTWKYYLVSV